MVDLIQVPEQAQVVRSVQRTTRSSLAPDELMPRLLEMNLSQMFVRWLYTPGVVDVVDETGQWGETGASRRLVLDNGGGMDEQVMYAESHTLVTRLQGFRKSFGPAMLVADDTWRVFQDGTGSRVEWTWKFYQPGRSPRAVVERVLWGFYMQYVLDHQLTQLETVPVAPRQLVTA